MNEVLPREFTVTESPAQSSPAEQSPDDGFARLLEAGSPLVDRIRHTFFSSPSLPSTHVQEILAILFLPGLPFGICIGRFMAFVKRLIFATR